MTSSGVGADTVSGYSIYQIGLHWMIAALVIWQLIFGDSMTAFVEAAEEGEPLSAVDGTIANLHYYIGVSILALAIVRLALNGAPRPLNTNPVIEFAGKLSHWLFYSLLVAVPVTGLLGFYVGYP